MATIDVSLDELTGATIIITTAIISIYRSLRRTGAAAAGGQRNGG